MSDVSDMLFEFYKANVAKAPKTQQPTIGLLQAIKFGQTSPTSAETHEPSSIAAIATNGASVVQNENKTISKNLKSDEMLASANRTTAMNSNSSNNDASGSSTSTAAFHPRIKYTNKSAGEGAYVKLTGVVEPTLTAIPTSVVVGGPTTPPPSDLKHEDNEMVDVKPLINPATGLVMSPSSVVATTVASVIKPVPGVLSTPTVPPAAAIAAALLRDGYHNFQKQLRAQEILKHHTGRVSGGSGGGGGVGVGVGVGASAIASTQVTSSSGASGIDSTGDDGAGVAGGMPTKILENFLRQHQHQQHQQQDQVTIDAATESNADDEEDDSRYNGFEDIHLVEGSTPKPNFGNQSLPNIFSTATNSTNISSPGGGGSGGVAGGNDYLSDESQKFMIAAQASVLRNFDYSLCDFSGVSGGAVGSASQDGNSPNGSVMGVDGEPVYECRHCGKKYRWKSTLRRHENVECGGKEPSHQCPYCPYKSKQRGNLGVHVRKHHSNLPQLASKRRSKYSTKLEAADGDMNSANASDDSSSSKLIIDCSK